MIKKYFLLQNYSKLITYVFQTCYKFVTKKPGDLTVARLSKPNPSQKLRLRFSLLSIYMPITYFEIDNGKSIYAKQSFQNYYNLFAPYYMFLTDYYLFGINNPCFAGRSSPNLWSNRWLHQTRPHMIQVRNRAIRLR